jgi:hypothetical protein
VVWSAQNDLRNTAESIAPFSALALAVPSVRAQSFQNPGFEQANPVVIPGNPKYSYAVAPANALRAWTGGEGYSRTLQKTELLFP